MNERNQLNEGFVSAEWGDDSGHYSQQFEKRINRLYSNQKLSTRRKIEDYHEKRDLKRRISFSVDYLD